MPPVQAEPCVGVPSRPQQQMESPWGEGCCRALKHKPPLRQDFGRASPAPAHLTQPIAEAKVSIETSDPGPALGKEASHIIFPSRWSLCPGTKPQTFLHLPAEPVQCLFTISSCLLCHLLCPSFGECCPPHSGPRTRSSQPPLSWWDPVTASAMLLTSKPTSPLCCPSSARSVRSSCSGRTRAWPGWRPASWMPR